MSLSGLVGSILADLIAAAILWIVPLGLTLAVELPIAAAFGLGRRGVAAAALVNVITNPVLVISMQVLYGLGVGFVGVHAHDLWALGGYYVLLVPLEIVVVVVEWKMLVWSLRASHFSSRRLLAASVVMNVASCLLGVAITSVVVMGSLSPF
jgi:hypothetical protein